MKVTAIKVDPLTIRHLVLRPLPFWIGFKRAHSFPRLTKEVGRTERDVQLWRDCGGRRWKTIRAFPNVSKYYPSQSFTRSIRGQTQESCRHVSKEAMKSCPSGVCLENSSPLLLYFLCASGETPIHPSKPNSTISFPQDTFLIWHQREQITPQYLQTLSSIDLYTNYTVVDHLPQAKHHSKGTGDKAMSKKDNKFMVYKQR